MIYPIYLNYDNTKKPIGQVIIFDDQVPMESLNECAIVPKKMRHNDDEPWRTISFGLIPRTNVDIKPKS